MDADLNLILKISNAISVDARHHTCVNNPVMHQAFDWCELFRTVKTSRQTGLITYLGGEFDESTLVDRERENNVPSLDAIRAMAPIQHSRNTKRIECG